MAPNPPAQRRSFVLQVSLLRLRLRKVALIPGEGVSRLFLKAQALLFGGYRDALVYSPVSSQDSEEEAFWTLKDNIDTYIYSSVPPFTHLQNEIQIAPIQKDSVALAGLAE